MNEPTTPKKPRGKRAANAKAHELRAKLQALAERGINGERDAAKEKLARLESRIDFSKAAMRTADLFAGKFKSAEAAATIARFTPEDTDITNAVKWAIETTTGIRCAYQNQTDLVAHADPKTAQRLTGIADKIALGARCLWREYAAAPGVNPADRSNFILGLYEGMMDEARSNEALPSRAEPPRKFRAKKAAVNRALGISLHPYSVAVPLGKQLRFAAPLESLIAELDKTIKGALPEVKP